jgi:hypothetical protein
MNRAKSYSVPEVFNNTLMGFVFEFYSSKKVDFIVENLSKLTTKNVILTNSGHNYKASYGSALLIKEYEGKKPRYSFELAQQRYDSIIPLMKEVTKWISETAECKADNLLRVNMSFDNRHLKTLSEISKMNPQKLILKIDEGFIYERFQDQQFSPYAMSIKNLLPLSEALYTPDMIKNINYIIGVPKDKFYGVNFENHHTGNLEFNYIGGWDYAEKENEIMEVLQYYVLQTYQSLNEAEFSKPEIRELQEMTDKYNKVHEAYYDPEKFRELFPSVKVAVDMRRDTQLLKAMWPSIRNTLFNTVVNNGLDEGDFNYDRDYGVFQVRNATLNCSGLKGFDLVSCEVSGVLESCNLLFCNVTHARIYNSKAVKGNDISNSYLYKITADIENEMMECFVENEHELLNCNISECILKFAGIGKNAKLDEETVIIDDQINYQPVIGIEVEENRDINWIRNLTGKKNEEDNKFANEYIKKTYI